MSRLLDGLARQLAADGVGYYDPSGAAMTADWSIFPGGLPQEPGRAIALIVYGSGLEEPDPVHGWGSARVQVVARGSADPGESAERAAAAYRSLCQVRSRVLPGGVWVDDVTPAVSEPVSRGQDQAGRHEHAITVDVAYEVS